MSNKPPTTETNQKRKQEEAPTQVIVAPLNYEQTHALAECPTL